MTGKSCINIYQIISKFRSELMGIAILGVMIGHIKTQLPTSIVSQIIGVFCYSVFTGGFLILSGYGLYHSMQKGCSVFDFYKNRVKRLIIPWLVLAIPFFALVDKDLVTYTLHTSTLYYWIGGNFYGMWYIAVTITLYLLYPLYHRIILGRENSDAIFFCFLTTFLGILAILYYKSYGVFDKIAVMPLFFVGSYFGKLANKEYFSRKREYTMLAILLLLYFITYIITRSSYFAIGGGNILCIFIWCVAFSYFQNNKSWLRKLQWFGKYSLELYILHLFIYELIKMYLVDSLPEEFWFPISVILAILFCRPINSMTIRISNKIIR